MTNEELTAIDEVIARAQQSSGMAAGHDVAMIHAPALLAEVRRLRALADGQLEIIHMLRGSIELYDGARAISLKVQP